jgi:hypothetical protein
MFDMLMEEKVGGGRERVRQKVYASLGPLGAAVNRCRIRIAFLCMFLNSEMNANVFCMSIHRHI